MFESAELGQRISKKDFRLQEPVLRQALLHAQYDLLNSAKVPVIVLVNGVHGAGKGETVNLFNQWMDPRHIRTEAFGSRLGEHYDRPQMWPFWQALPPKGRMAILFGSWYAEPILSHALGHDKKARFAQRLEQIRHFERMLVAEGAVLVKLWFHLSKAAARQRFKELESDPITAWRVTREDRERLRHYDELISASAQALSKTSTDETPWRVIDGSDKAYRSLTAGQYLLSALQGAAGAIQRRPPAAVATGQSAGKASATTRLDNRTLLGSFDYSRKLSRKNYETELEILQGRLAKLCRDTRMASRSLAVVFEGMDAAGKGSTIRRVTQALDARYYHVVPVAAPTQEEHAHPYLWRFWRHVPRQGSATFFDRSWYGRVLVERVEQLCATAEWMRAYDEINAFEEQLAQSGAIIVKFWMAITPTEQLRRFEERKTTPYKNFKITDEDWRNRKKWPAYERAVGDMVDRTSTELAPWHVVASDDKLFARIEVLRHLCERIELTLGSKKRQPTV